MTSFNLHLHQQAVVPRVLASLRSGRRALLIAPTGSGKTVMAAEIALSFRRVLFVAHRIEITDQARLAMGRNVQSMSIAAALKYGRPEVDLLVIDEAHRAASNTYRELIRKYRGASILGLTATPLRTDGRGLIDMFDELVEGASVASLIKCGHLTPYRALEAPDEALSALSTMRKERGDYAMRELAELMLIPRLVGDVVREYKAHGATRRAVAFAVSIEHSKALESAFLAAGVRARHIDGTVSDKVRSAALAALASHEIDVLCNVNLFTEGWDCPPVSCIIQARPTCSLTLHLQSIGRGMRPDPVSGKTDLLILDHAGNIARHGYPDDPREWSLESDSQKAKREAELAQLEQLYALGYESLEQYRLIQKPSRLDLIDGVDLATRLKMKHSTAANFMRYCGFSPIRLGRDRGIGKSTRKHFKLSDVESAEAYLRENYSASQVRALLGLSGQVSAVLKKAGIAPSMCRSGRTYYPKKAVDDLCAVSDKYYTPTQARERLGNMPFPTFWRLMQAEKVTWTREGIGSTGGRYLKSDVERIVSERSVMYSATEARELLRLSNNQFCLLVKKYSIKRLGAGTRDSRYLRVDIDTLRRELGVSN